MVVGSISVKFAPSSTDTRRYAISGRRRGRRWQRWWDQAARGLGVITTGIADDCYLVQLEAGATFVGLGRPEAAK